MTPKKLEPKSKYAEFDLDGDGTVTDAEISRHHEMLQQELAEEKADTQRRMAWVAMISMIAYPLASLVISESRLDTWSAMSDMIFLSQASVIGLYFGATAYMSKK